MRKEIMDALEEERKVSKLLGDVREAVKESVRDAGEMPGVSTIKAPFPCCTVRLSAIRATPSLNLSPHYYSQANQAQVVEQKLAGAKTVAELIQRITEMTEKKQAVIGTERYALNPITVKVLNSYI